jgi:ATP-dependent DNA ligase
MMTRFGLSPSIGSQSAAMTSAPSFASRALRACAAGDAIQINEHMQGGAAMFEHACKLGLEGIVSKHRNRAYRAGWSRHWIKVKNPASPAMLRVEDGSW